MRTARIKIAPVAALAVLVAGFGAGVVTPAAADSPRCHPAAGQPSLAIDAVIAKAEALGYSVHETKMSKGCWKVEGYDRNGAEIEIRFHPTTGEVVTHHNWRPAAAPSSR